MRVLVRCASFFLLMAGAAVSAFAVCDAPTIVAPPNGSTISKNALGTVVLEWTANPAAENYDIFFGPVGSGCSAGFPHATENGLEWSPPGNEVIPGTTYEWKVEAKGPALVGCDPAPVSSCATFTVACPTAAPSLSSPNNGSSFQANTQVRFDWNPVPSVETYDLLVSNDGGATWDEVSEGLTRTFEFHSFEDPGEYQWAVRANFDGDCSPTLSGVREFSITAACGQPSLDLESPANGTSVSNPVKFEWNGVDGATGYRLYASPLGSTVPTLLATTVRKDYTTTLDAGTYDWYVVATRSGCPEITSAHRTVTIQTTETGCPANPGKATLLAPADNATNLSSPVTFSWSSVPGATEYRVFAAFGSATAELVSLGTTSGTTLTADVPAGSAAWRVQTLFGDNCPTTLSDRRTFTVSSGATCSGAEPQIISPPNGATNVPSQVTFQWSAVPDAIRYRLYAAAGDGEFSFYGDTNDTSLDRFVPTGTVRWFVVANFAACPDTRSATASFEVAGGDCPKDGPQLVSPADQATTSSPVQFSWTAVGGSDAYRLWLSVNGAAPVILTRTTSTTATVNLPSGEMRWFVEALRAGCPSVVSDQRRFTVSEGANCDENQAPTLISPVGTRDDPPIVTGPVTLSWNAVPGAIGYRVWVGEDGEAFADVKLTLDTHVEVDLDPDEYGWYVDALFAGCPEESSEVAFFTLEATEERCGNVAPAIIAPIDGAETTSPVTFMWSEVPDAELYRVIAQINDSPAVILASTYGRQIVRSLPPGTVKWTVEAVFDECPSTFSPRVQFTIAAAQNCSHEKAQLVAPPDGAENVGPDIDFAWNPVSGAIRYAVIARVGDGTPTTLGSTQETHFTTNLPPGHIEWWVVSLFDGCDPTQSDHFTLERAEPSENCPRRKPILLFPRGNSTVTSPVHFVWTAAPDAVSYNLWASLGDETPSIIATTTDTGAVVDLPQGTYTWFVETIFDDCPALQSASGEFVVGPPVACGTPAKPRAQVIGQALSGSTYRVRWTPLPNVGLYELQESTSLDFSSAVMITTDETSQAFSHEVTGDPVQYLYRVRGVSECNDDRGPYSSIVGVFVVAPTTSNASAEIGSGDALTQTIFLPGGETPISFTATVDKPWLTVSPASGTLPPEGITLTVTANPSVLAIGTNTGTVKVEYGGEAANGPRTNGTTTASIPLSISIVTPVEPAGKGTPPPDSLIFPVVGHAEGANNSLFETDIRVTNLTAQTMKYQVNFTPSNTDGTITGSTSTIEIEPNQTMALDDIVSSLFGTGTTTNATGMLEVRPLTTTSSSTNSYFTSITGTALKELSTVASSRTYNFTSTGTFGQFIPAVFFADFVGKVTGGSPPSILSLQQVAQSSAYRANFGFAEASGNPVNLVARVYDTANQLLATIPVALKATEHLQLNGMLSNNGISDLQDGRVEVEVTSGDGKFTTYVSEVDNHTNDPLEVSPVLKGAVSSNRYVLPGVAHLDLGFAFWVTDMRIFNAGDSSTDATLTFYPQTGDTNPVVSKQITIGAGEIAVLDDIARTLFELPANAGGSVVITTPTETSLTATARTYNQTENGTYGQYIPAVTPAESVGAGERALQILQLEQSSRFRTNIGLAETSGEPVSVEVSAIVPDTSIVTPVVTYNLKANEYRQFSLAQFFPPDTAVYNARVTVKAVSGTGRVTAYGSAIDSDTQDPTYVPAQ